MMRVGVPLLVVALALAAATAGVLVGRWWFPAPGAQSSSGSLQFGERRPELQLPALDGTARNLSEFDGAPLLINYWATWCPPCIEELPRLADLHARRDSDGVAVLTIALEHDVAAVAAFVDRHGLALPVLTEPPGPGDSSVGFGNLRGVLPYSVLLDAEGRLLQRRSGALRDADLAEWTTLVR